MQSVEFFLLLHPASEETVVNEKMDLRNVREEKANDLFQNKFAVTEKIITFAARFGRTGSWLKPVILKSGKEKQTTKK